MSARRRDDVSGRPEQVTDRDHDMAPPVLEILGVSKRYGGVVACDRVNLELRAGQVHGILGENGAGKSTLLRLIFGLVPADSGVVKIDGQACQITDPADAARRGLGMVHQHHTLVDSLTVWENIALGETGPLDPDSTKRRIREISQRYGLEVAPDVLVRDLPIGIRRRVEIIKCLARRPRIILLDEPTSALSPAESTQLFDMLRQGAAADGWAVALVSHRLDEMLAATDTITVMRDGRVTKSLKTAGADVPSLARAMVGEEVSNPPRIGAMPQASGRPLDRAQPQPDSARPASDVEQPTLRIEQATFVDGTGRSRLAGLSIEVRAGEIVGVAGMEGNGQTALADLLSGLLRLDEGSVMVAGRAVRSGVAGAMAKGGVAVIPADPLQSGYVLGMTVAENLMIPLLDTMPPGGLLRRRTIRRHALDLIEEYSIRTPDPDTPLYRLSGGNRQRVVVARALSTGPKVVVAHQPTQALDVTARHYVTDRLRRAARAGSGILVISTDSTDLADLADRVVVIDRGRIVGDLTRADLEAAPLSLLMTETGFPIGSS